MRAMPLVFVPDRDSFFLWGNENVFAALPGLDGCGRPDRVEIVTPEGRRAQEGVMLPLLETAARLAMVPASIEFLPASVGIWV
ncbi:MAG TPA: hypothetical protein VGJ84_17180, partial [Polyangiaceae bacterium]